MLRIIRWPYLLARVVLQIVNGRCRPAERPAHKDSISRPRPRSQNSLAPRHGPGNDNVGQYRAGRLRRIPSRQRGAVSIRQSDQSAEKALHPRLRQIPRQRQRQKSRQRFAAHGCNIAQPSSQTAVPNRLRWMPISTEVNALQTEVARDQCVLGSPCLQDGAVVPNPNRHWGTVTSFARRSGGSAHPPRSFGPRHPADQLNERFFWKRHAHQYTALRRRRLPG